MRFGIGHGPRLHLNLFGGRCHWPCIQPATSSIGSHSTHSSLLDNDYTSSWTYLQYGSPRNGSSNNSSTFNDTELISLVNEGIVQEEGVVGAGNNQSQNSNETGAATPWANQIAGDRHARRDVRTLFPEAGFFSGNGQVGANGQQETNFSGSMNECQYVNVPLAREQASRECVPFYTASRSSNNSSSRHSSLRQSLSELFDFDNPSPAESNDWATGGDHPYGIPSSLLGGVLLNLDNQFRLSANTEWQNWGEFLTSAQEVTQESETATGGFQANNGTGQYSTTSSRNSGTSAAASNSDSNDANNSLNNESTTNSTTEENDNDILPTAAVPPSGFLHRQFTLPPPPSSNSSTQSSGSGTRSRPRQQEWYFYDPRLVSEQRTQRVTLDTSFRGLHNRCHMSSIIQPPSYDDIIQGDDLFGGESSLSAPLPELPPPYTETEPPPSYDQSFGHALALPTFQLGSLPINPMERRLAASLCMSPLVLSSPLPDPDLLTDVNIDELLDGPSENNNNQSNSQTNDNDLPGDNSPVSDDDMGETTMEQNTSEEEDDMENEEDTEVVPSDGEAENSGFSLRRYPVGFCLGRRPPLRWSRGMAPNRWAPTENWASGSTSGPT